MVSSTVVVSDDRRASDGIAEKYSRKEEVNIHDRAVCSNAVFSGKPDKLEVIQGIYHRHGQIRHQLGRAVGACLSQDPFVKMRFPKS